MRFKNLNIWYGRLPHWRAEDVTYYVTFRHSRELDAVERGMLLNAMLRSDGRRWDLLILCVLPERTEALFTIRDRPSGEAYELSDVVEKSKAKVGKMIQKRTGERYPPFYGESYDRIVRDQIEFEDRFQEILESPVSAELVEAAEDYDALWVPNRP
jgi:hypothetical protein